MKYQNIFFDLDHTLWDFDKNAQETIHELYITYDFKGLGVDSVDLFIETYTKNNHRLWREYHLGYISKSELRERRFKETFVELGLDAQVFPDSFEEDYVKICPTKTNLFPHAHEILTYLSGKYNLHLISNGFKESTEYKLKNTKLGNYFSNVVISEVVGVNKPDKAIFEYALGLAKGRAEESVMIGDSLEADIRGAKNLGMDAIYFNPNFLEVPQDVDQQINNLFQLREIL